MARARIDRVAPPFDLPASTGGRVASWDFKSRAPLILFFPHQDCPRCCEYLGRLSRDAARDYEHQAQLLALLPASLADCQRLAAQLHLPFPLLADAPGTARNRYLDDSRQVALFVLDRYGEPYGRWLAADADALPAAEPVLSALELTELECPECGVPEWS